MAVIKVENLTKIYRLYDKKEDRVKEALNPFKKKYHKEFYALKDVSFEVKKGEMVGIIGKNGSGKSTLLKIITGVLTQSSGEIYTNGKISSLLELGTGFNPEYSGIENIYFNGMIMGFTKEEMDNKLNEIIEFADIGDFLYQPVKTYSSGMFVRLAFAVSINVDPDILIVDEALSVGDARFQAKCYAKFESFKKNGKTIIFVSHALETIKMYCDRTILINDGIKVTEGNSKVVVDLYLKMLRDNEITKSMSKNAKADIKLQIYTQEEGLFNIEECIWYNKNENKYGTNEAVFTRVGLFDLKGNVTQQFETGSYMNFIFEFIVNDDMEELFFGFGIRNMKGQDLYVFNGTTQYDDFSIKSLKKSSLYKINLKSKVFLVPDDYFVTLALSKKNGEEYVHTQIRYDVITFRVDGTGRAYAGIIYNNTDVSLIP